MKKSAVFTQICQIKGFMVDCQIIFALRFRIPQVDFHEKCLDKTNGGEKRETATSCVSILQNRRLYSMSLVRKVVLLSQFSITRSSFFLE